MGSGEIFFERKYIFLIKHNTYLKLILAMLLQRKNILLLDLEPLLLTEDV